jgi:hypothetical protein
MSKLDTTTDPFRAPGEASGEPTALTFVVEDSFDIPGRGVVLAPAFESDRFRSGTRFTVSISAASEDPRVEHGQFLVEHIRLAGGGSRWHGVFVLDEGAARVEPGTRVSCSPIIASP